MCERSSVLSLQMDSEYCMLKWKKKNSLTISCYQLNFQLPFWERQLCFPKTYRHFNFSRQICQNRELWEQPGHPPLQQPVPLRPALLLGQPFRPGVLRVGVQPGPQLHPRAGDCEQSRHLAHIIFSNIIRIQHTSLCQVGSCVQWRSQDFTINDYFLIV